LGLFLFTATGTGKMDKTTVKANLKAEAYVLPDFR